MFQRELSNGIRVIFEPVAGIRSATIGIWVKAGSVTERDAQNGISHFIEHMLFKGTEKRSYRQIAEDIDHLGAQANAFTSKEFTCYYIKVIDEKLPEATEILLDMFVNSAFATEELQKERGVILEEISMSNDNPEDVLHEKLAETFFSGTPLSKPIIGTTQTVGSFTRDDLLAYRKERYTAQNIAVVIVGSFQEEALVGQLEEALSQIKAQELEATRSPERWSASGAFVPVEKDTEQVHLGLAFPAYHFLDPKKYALSVAANILGGTMSSRLFQKVREEMGMAYAVFCYPAVYERHGMLAVYAGTSPENAPKVTDAIIGEIKRLKTDYITQDEFIYTKEQLRGSYILGEESSSSRMNSIGKSILLSNRALSEQEVLAAIEKVGMEDVREVIQEVFDLDRMTRVLVGPARAMI